MRLIDADALNWKLKTETGGSWAMVALVDSMPTVDIDWAKHEMTTGDSKSVTGNPAYPLGGGGNYQCSNTVDVVPVKSIEQLKWERDTAIQQLEEHGIPFCGKADVVAVVRCKDCNFYSRCTDHQGICMNRYMDGFIVPDWYCADGERREEDAEA